MKIEGRTFIISGGASGLGRATAIGLAAKGAYISILDLPTSAHESLSSIIDTSKARFFPCDVTDSSQISAAISGTIEWIKKVTEAPLAGVICSAGVSYPEKIINKDGAPMDLSRARWVINVNLFGTIDLIRQSLLHLTTVDPIGPDNERGVIIMVSSSAAFDGQPGQVAYSASKGAIRSVTLPMARDLARYGVRVVTIAPSLFETAMTAKMDGKVRESLIRTTEWPKRPGKAEEFAHLVVACVENTMLNGEVVRLDGAVRMPSKM
ncbi:hypothetical protein BDZ91DRAFT_681113 [Kalaharituber pfeilii]|nr:hypothetical protein BDZ91DRAFT_681113 [Kalaharituber pfeilii]